MKGILLALIFVALSTIARAEVVGGTSGDVKWSLDIETGIFTLSGEGKMDDYTWQSDVPWDSYTGKITQINIEYGVTRIGRMSFFNCYKASLITIPSSVTYIGEQAFAAIHLNSLAVPSSVTYIGERAFDGIKNVIYEGEATGSPWNANAVNGVIDGDFIYKDETKTTLCAYLGNDQDVRIPNNVTSIGYKAFSSCKYLKSITIPNSVVAIGEYAFELCSKLTSITIPSSVTNIGEYAFFGCDGLVSVTIPSSITNIEHCMFSCCYGLESVKIQEGVKTIGKSAFNECTALSSIVIPESITSIGKGAFWNCHKLISIAIPQNVITIDEDAFRYCSGLTLVNVPKSVTNIGENAFLNVRHITYSGEAIGSPWGALSVNGFIDGDFVYEDESKTVLNAYIGEANTVTIPTSVTNIEAKAFYECHDLSSVTIPNSVSYIGESAFSSVKHITYHGEAIGSPWGALSINGYVEGDFVFEDETKTTLNVYMGCDENVVIPNGVVYIEQKAFYWCQNLKTITIPCTITTIGGVAFYHCDKLSNVISHSIIAPTRLFIIFDSNSPLKDIHIPVGATASYQEKWGTYYNYIEDADALTSINETLSSPIRRSIEGIYDLTGRKLSAPQRGINIINGKKVIVK